MDSTLATQPYDPSDLPSIKLIELHFMHSRRRSVKRHNAQILRVARRRQRVASGMRLLGLRRRP